MELEAGIKANKGEYLLPIGRLQYNFEVRTWIKTFSDIV